MTTKEEIKQIADGMLKNGVTPPECIKIGCFRTGFRPFDDFETEESWYDRENGSFEDRFSTIYGGWRWHFETAEQLKAFCKAVGQA
ncbi:MAG: hypothetical protein IJ752_07400 [Alphaproteobacteria bacterium]|nr:hypothetical protein [Alphaproteobacteria bacterium]